jgi:hypothetical protein
MQHYTTVVKRQSSKSQIEAVRHLYSVESRQNLTQYMFAGVGMNVVLTHGRRRPKMKWFYLQSINCHHRKSKLQLFYTKLPVRSRNSPMA